MKKISILFLVVVLQSVALSSRAAPPKPAPEPDIEKPDIIVPLNVRDPSALVMGPGATYPGPTAVSEADVPSGARVPQALAPGLWARLPEKAGERMPMPKGYRSVSLPVSGDELLDLRSGDRVDIISVFDAVGTTKVKEKMAATILQNVKVLGTGVPKGGEGQGTVLLMLNPVEAQFAILAIQQGSIAISRRDPGDVEIYPMEISTYRKLFR
jgi:hypothetical protein